MKGTSNMLVEVFNKERPQVVFYFAFIVLEDKFMSMGGRAFHSLQTLLK